MLKSDPDEKMRLLNTETLRFQEFYGYSIPEYVILSHTWDAGEVTFQDMTSLLGSDTAALEQKEGFIKIKGFCSQARKDGFAFGWVDTCCIDKTNLVELSEAINSMYNWYRLAQICYVYLRDVETADIDTAITDHQFRHSQWFHRGWTLQELLAPRVVEFYARDWSEIGTKLSLKHRIHEITAIRLNVLTGVEGLADCSVAERMSWAARRQTTRTEDIAYSLLGIFGVNMPLIYGEGRRAFERLQEEILRTTDDHTILAWGIFGPHMDTEMISSAFAPHPSYFSRFGIDTYEKLKPFHVGDVVPLAMTSRGLRVPWATISNGGKLYLPLSCYLILDGEEDQEHAVAIQVDRRGNYRTHYRKAYCSPSYRVFPRSSLRYANVDPIYLGKVRNSAHILYLRRKTLQLSLGGLDKRWSVAAKKENTAFQVFQSWTEMALASEVNLGDPSSAYKLWRRGGNASVPTEWQLRDSVPYLRTNSRIDRRGKPLHVAFYHNNEISFVVVCTGLSSVIVQPKDVADKNPSAQTRLLQPFAFGAGEETDTQIVYRSQAIVREMIRNFARVDDATDRMTAQVGNFEVKARLKLSGNNLLTLTVSSTRIPRGRQ